MTTRVSITKTLRCSPPGDLTVADLKAFLADEPEGARVNVKSEYPDRPGEIGQVTITLTEETP